ncbi:tyrosine-protein kinase CSK-like [Aethina tumida]|uniref:tyrosine-protein kinase CSK-like n=1 Tax=Aethina tumida TaxID=116153 RepID=UPI002147C79E|nr:tyrosine-protein kinase CSK-like [Aethina tumida]
MSTENTSKECIRVMQKLLDIMRAGPELVVFMDRFLTNIQKCDRRVLMCDAVNSLFTEECFFTTKNLELFKNNIKIIAPPKLIQEKEVSSDRISFYPFKILGCGGFSTVHLGTLKNDSQNTKIAVKITESSLNEFMLEISAMCKLSHQNILPILGYNLENKMILTEYMEKGSLHDVCCFKNVPTTNHLYKYIFEVIQGLQFIHDNKFIHRDLSIRNVFVDENNSCKIGDFGFAVHVGNAGQFRSQGSRLETYHSSPESFYEQKFSYASDIFSLGILILEIMLSPAKITNPLLLRLPNVTIPKPKRCPDNLYRIIQSSLDINPQRRPTIKDFNVLIKSLLE